MNDCKDKLEIKNIEKSFGSIKVLQNINFSLNRGEIMSVIGPSGSGKSTLLQILGGIILPEKGEYHLFGENILLKNLKERTRFRGLNIGFIFQNFQLLPMLTALENVMLGIQIASPKMPLTQVKEQSQNTLEAMQLTHRLHHYPHQLSGGEQGRVGIARAIAKKPQLLLADEPTANLDKETASSVLNHLFEIIRLNQTSTIIVTHDIKITEMTDKCFQITNH